MRCDAQGVGRDPRLALLTLEKARCSECCRGVYDAAEALVLGMAHRGIGRKSPFVCARSSRKRPCRSVFSIRARATRSRPRLLRQRSLNFTEGGETGAGRHEGGSSLLATNLSEARHPPLPHRGICKKPGRSSDRPVFCVWGNHLSGGAGALPVGNVICGSDVRSLEDAMGPSKSCLADVLFPPQEHSRVIRPDTVLKPDQRHIGACEPSVTGEDMQLLRGRWSFLPARGTAAVDCRYAEARLGFGQRRFFPLKLV